MCTLIFQHAAKALANVMGDVRSHFNDDDIIVLGDTNCLRSDEEALVILTGSDFKDLNARDAHTYVTATSGSPFDHILVPEGQPEFRFSRQYQISPSDATRHRGSLSDHVLVVTALQVQPDDDGTAAPAGGVVPAPAARRAPAPPVAPAFGPQAPGAAVAPGIVINPAAPVAAAAHLPARPTGPGNYYAGINTQAQKAQFKQQLHQLIKVQTKLSYDSLWNHLSYTDESRQDRTKVELFYTGWPRAKNLNGGGPSDWNREHVWAKSRGQFGTSRGAGTDLHHIRATDVTVNSARGNLAFDVGGQIYNDNDGPTTNKVDNDSWEPRNEVKGDVARMLFYMAVRYEGNGEPDLELEDVVSTPGGTAPRIGKLSVLLQWHQADQVDDTERQRNNRIHQRQGNRNPFIDHPGWVSKLWP